MEDYQENPVARKDDSFTFDRRRLALASSLPENHD